MNLRPRMLVTLAVASIPLVFGIAWWRARGDREVIQASMIDFAMSMMHRGGKELCDEYPEDFPIPILSLGRLRSAEESMRQADAPSSVPRRPPPTAMRRLGNPPPPRPRGGDGDRESESPIPRSTGRAPLAGSLPSSTPRGPTVRLWAELPEPHGPPFRKPELSIAGHRPLIRFFAFDEHFNSRNHRVPSFPPELMTRLAKGELRAGRLVRDAGGEPKYQLAIRTDWPRGPSAILLIERLTPLPPFGVDQHLGTSAAPALLMLLLATLLMSPVVQRVRRLTDLVRAAAADGYRISVAIGGNDELTRLAQTFDEAGANIRAQTSEVERRERVLREFVENTVHDVAMPLTVLQGSLMELRDARGDVDTPGHDALSRAIEEAAYMDAILSNLSTAARLEGEIPLERGPIDLRSVVERAISRHLPVARQRGTSLDHAVPPHPVLIDADVTLIEQMISNVVHNAIRYGNVGGHVAAVVDVTRDRFQLTVLDDGPGIDDDLMERVTERAIRGGNARARYPNGYGLGLAIALDIAARHHFELTLTNVEPHGLRVDLRGPLVRGTKQTPPHGESFELL